jgi:hypothetical protein
MRNLLGSVIAGLNVIRVAADVDADMNHMRDTGDPGCVGDRRRLCEHPDVVPCSRKMQSMPRTARTIWVDPLWFRKIESPGRLGSPRGGDESQTPGRVIGNQL